MMWNFEKYGDKIAVISDESECLTYHELKTEGLRLCQQVEERSLIFILCTNTIGAIIGYTGFLNNKAVPLLLDSHLDKDLLQYLLEAYKPLYLWVPDLISQNFSSYVPVYQKFHYTLLKNTAYGVIPMHEDLALLLTTSGSTGSPKLVRQSYQNIKSNIRSIAEYLELSETEKPITTLPMNYTYGLSIINSHLYVGATILLTDKSFIEKEFWSFFKKYEASSFGGVPYSYEILDRLRFYNMKLPSLKTMTQAGGKLSLELHKKIAEYAKKNDKHFIVMYGQTEATARMAYLPYDKSLEKYGSMGVAIPGGKFSLIDTDGNMISESDVVGELVYEGPNVTLGYAENAEDLIKGDERKGKLITGDMAKVDGDGYYYIVGRKKRFLKIYGNRVNLDEAERLIKSHFKQLDCACIGEDDNMQIFVTSNVGFDNIKKFISEKTGLNLAAFQIYLINEIPKNETGKTLYTKLSK